MCIPYLFCGLIHYLLHLNPNIKLLTLSGFNVYCHRNFEGFANSKTSPFLDACVDLPVSPLKIRGTKAKTVRDYAICLVWVSYIVFIGNN